MSTPERTRETERRRATVLFADITGFTGLTERSDVEEAYSLVTGCLKTLDGVARKHGGSVDKYLGDCIMAVFGVPRAIEDAPKSAVNAAIEMLKAVRDYSRERGLDDPLGIHIGINTGFAISGDVSGPVLREFAVMGDPVNVASRLKDLAPTGHVYVGAETYRYTRDEFDYEALAPLTLKGKSLRVAAYDLRSQTERLHRARVGAGRAIFTELVNREAELARLRECIAAAAGGRGGVATLVGEAGLGKSRILYELLGSEDAAGLTWLEARSIPQGRTLSYHPFADLLRSWAEIGEEGDDDARKHLQQVVGETLGPRAEEAVPFLTSLAGLRLSAAQERTLRPIQGEAMEHVLFRHVRELLLALSARHPLVVVFDDLHWADGSSLQLLESLLGLSAEAPILFLLALRPGYAETGERVLAHVDATLSDRHVRVTLAPLDRRDTGQLLHNAVPHGEIPAELVPRIEEKTAGNPFFIEEVVRSLVEQGATQAGDLPRDVQIPGSIQEVVMTRIDRLPLETKAILDVASVIGRGLYRSVIHDVVGDEVDLDAPLAQLEAAGMLIRRDRHGRRYGFKHPLIQDVAYESILKTRCEELHIAAARAIEDRLSETLPGYNGMLAYHFSLGRDLERAEEYLFKAGDDAAKLAASDEALHHFREASQLYMRLHGEGGDPEKQALLERNIATALANRGQYIEAVEHFNRALRHRGVRVPTRMLELVPRLCRDVLSALAWLYVGSRRGNRRAATPVEREINELYHDRARAQTTVDPTRWVFDSMNGLRRLNRVDPATVRQAGGQYASVIGFLSFGGVSFSLSRRLLPIAERLVDPDDPQERLIFQSMRFFHHVLEGDWSDEHEIDAALIEENLRLGQLWEVVNYLGLDAERKLRQGRFDEAQAHIAWLEKIEQTYHFDLARSTRRGVQTFLLLEQDRIPEAVEAADVYYAENREEVFNLLALGSRAKALTLDGDLEGGEASLREAEAILARAPVVLPYYRSSVFRSRLLLEVSSLAAAVESGDRGAVRAARSRARRAAGPALAAAAKVAARQPEVWRLEGTRRWLCGERRRALECWERGLACAERLGMRPECERTEAEIAQRRGAEAS